MRRGFHPLTLPGHSPVLWSVGSPAPPVILLCPHSSPYSCSQTQRSARTQLLLLCLGRYRRHQVFTITQIPYVGLLLMVNVLFMFLPKYLLNQQLYKILMHVLQCVLLCCTMYCPVKNLKCC